MEQWATVTKNKVLNRSENPRSPWLPAVEVGTHALFCLDVAENETDSTLLVLGRLTVLYCYWILWKFRIRVLWQCTSFCSASV